MAKDLNLYGAAVFAVVAAATAGGHEIGDYWEQPDWAARGKQAPGAAGHRALARHIGGYSAVQAVATAGALRATGLRVPAGAVITGQAINALSHWVIDRGPALRWAAEKSGKGTFHAVASGGVCGRMLLDQAAHKGIAAIAAAVTALLARRAVRA